MGWNPIKSVGLKYGETWRFEDLETHHFSQMQSWYHLPSAPSVDGYNVYSIEDCTSIDSEAGLDLGNLKAKMFFKLDDPEKMDFTPKSVYLDETEESTEDAETERDDTLHSVVPSHTSPSFKVRVRLLVLKKLSIEKTEDGYEFRI